MVDKEKVEQRLIKLEQALRKLRKIGEYSWSEYCNNEELQDRAERNLHISAQACIDIATHIIADQGFKAPQGYADAFEILREEGIIPIELAEEMKRVAGFRNILVHDYLEINHKIVYASLKDLDDFVEYAKHILKLL